MTRLEAPGPDTRPEAETFDDRWNAWQARGLRRAERMRRHLRVVFAAGVLAAGAAALWWVSHV